jgi:hypothetical protein
MNWFLSFFNKIFLVKEIISKEGVVHFRRYRLFHTPWFRIYIHKILKSDEDIHLHSHPWHLLSFILRGSYSEIYAQHPNWKSLKEKTLNAGNVNYHKPCDIHKLTLKSKEVWSFVIAYGKSKNWGYRLKDGTFIDHKKYRQLKNAFIEFKE